MIVVTFPGFLSFWVNDGARYCIDRERAADQNPTFHYAIVQRTNALTVKRRGFRPTFAPHSQA